MPYGPIRHLCHGDGKDCEAYPHRRTRAADIVNLTLLQRRKYPPPLETMTEPLGLGCTASATVAQHTMIIATRTFFMSNLFCSRCTSLAAGREA